MTQPQAGPPPQFNTVWIRTEPDIDGIYRATVDVNDDIAFPLDRDSAMTYAYSILAAVTEAEYDSSVIRQLGNLSDMDSAIQIVKDLRADRPERGQVGPLVLTPGVSQQTGEAFLSISLDGTNVGEWSVADAREHALTALETILVAELDSAYLRCLRGLVGLEEGRARNVIDDLGKWRDEAQPAATRPSPRTPQPRSKRPQPKSKKRKRR